MAVRPVFRPRPDWASFVEEVPVEFVWSAGQSKAQAQRSIAAWHEAAGKQGIERVLEISSKSPSEAGVKLSAFNLTCRVANGMVPVECAYQASKVFERGGPFVDLLGQTPKAAKTDPRLSASGRLTGFRLDGRSFPAKPSTAFYDWLYLAGLAEHQDLAAALLAYDGFTDIIYNPSKGVSCQAGSAALFVALDRKGWAERAMADAEYRHRGVFHGVWKAD